MIRTSIGVRRWAALCVLAGVAPASQAVVFGVSWNRDAVIRFTDNMNELAAFSTRDEDPNAVATDGDIIWTGHHRTRTVAAYTRNGGFLYSWFEPSLDALRFVQGMQYLGDNRLAVLNGNRIQIHQADTGALLRSFPSVSSSAEGIALDGANLWQIVDSQIYLTRLSDGANLLNIPNPLAGSPFDGTGIMNFDAAHLLAVGSNGAWRRIRKADGGVVASGNAGVDLFDVATPVPEPGTLAALGLGLAAFARRRARRA